MPATLVSAFIPLQRRGPDMAEYMARSRLLLGLDLPKILFMPEACIAECRAHAHADSTTFVPFEADEMSTEVPMDVRWQLPSQRGEGHDTHEYMQVMLHKTAWMVQAAELRPMATHLLWVDLGLIHVFPGRNPVLFEAAVRQAAQSPAPPDTKVCIAGIWPHAGLTHEAVQGPAREHVLWYLAGGVFGGHPSALQRFHAEVRAELAVLTREQRCTWEVNVWALVLARCPDLFAVYAADHNPSILTGYGCGRPHTKKMLSQDNPTSTRMQDLCCMYINLDESVDRRQHIEQELGMLPSLTRISATRHANGAYGLAQTLLRVLDMVEAQDKELICIFEDDFQWEIPHEEIEPRLVALMQQSFDLVLLSYHLPVVQLHQLAPPLARVSNGQTTCCFMFRRSFTPHLRRVFEQSVAGLLEGPSDTFAVDQTWKALQVPEHGTFAAIPRLGKQRAGFSTIEHQDVEYGGGCFVIILSCHAYAERRQQQDLSQMPFSYRYFVGQTEQPAAGSLPEDVVQLECGDYYEDLPMKTFCALQWVRQHYPHIDYVLKTDDDIVFDFERLYALYTQTCFQRIDYSGNVSLLESHHVDTTYHYGKCHDKSKEVPFALSFRPLYYCSGGGYFLSRRAVTACLDSVEVYRSHLMEDMATGQALQTHGIHATATDIHTGGACQWS